MAPTAPSRPGYRARAVARIALASLAIAGPAWAGDKAAARLDWADRLTWGRTAAPDPTGAPGPGHWLSVQLHAADATLPAPASDLVAAMRISREPVAQLVVAEEAANRDSRALTDPVQKKAARDAYEKSMNALADEARARSLLRDLYAPDQLREQMTWFWLNHFSVQAGKRDIRAMIGDYEDRLHDLAFGRFCTILEATLRHPAMLRYLDNEQNAAGHVNENYAREIMELHTMGVGSGYSQDDVQELARILTGVGIDLKPDPPRLRPELRPFYIRAGLFEFNPARHDFGDKRFLGHVIHGAGYAEVKQALDLIVASPATAHHVSERIATYFVGDAPPAALVDRMAATFTRTHGDIAKVVRAMVQAPEFAGTLGHGFKDPVHYAVSAVRLGYGDRVIPNPAPLAGMIARMGEGLFAHETPDGYPLAAAAWSGPGQMTTRFDVARQIGGGGAGLFRRPGDPPAPPVPPPLQAAVAAGGGALAPATRDALAQAGSPQEWNALYLASPDFMLR